MAQLVRRRLALIGKKGLCPGGSSTFISALQTNYFFSFYQLLITLSGWNKQLPILPSNLRLLCKQLVYSEMQQQQQQQRAASLAASSTRLANNIMKKRDLSRSSAFLLLPQGSYESVSSCANIPGIWLIKKKKKARIDFRSTNFSFYFMSDHERPDRTFHNCRATRNKEQPNLCSSEMSIGILFLWLRNREMFDRRCE